MTTKIAINGFGRIGRNVARQLYSSATSGSFELVAVNDLTNAGTLAHLLQHDSVHGRFPQTVTAEESSIIVGDTKLQVLSERDPAKLPWSKLGVDVVLECTGYFTAREKAAAHLSAGAKKVLVSAPSPDADATIAYGVNHEIYDASKHDVVSCASCTTNCLAPVAKVLLENFGIKHGTMTTIHAYTNDQSVLDVPHKDLRRARAAGMSLIPTTTGAARAVGIVIPELKGKCDGYAIRVPTPDVSIVDFVAQVERETSIEEVNRALKSASENALKGVLGFSEEPLVSIDYTGNPHSSIVDSLCTMVVGGDMVKVVAWYDNEMGFSTRMLDVAAMLN